MTGKVITILETREGLGQALVGLNLSLAISGLTSKTVCLADMNFLNPGELAILLNLKIPKYLDDLLPLVSELDERLFRGYLIHHHAGIDILPGKSEKINPQDISVGHIEKIITLLRNIYPYSIIMPEKQITERLLSILDSTDLILLIAVPHILSLYQAANILNELKKNHYPLGMVKVIVNMSDIKGGLPASAISEYLKQPIFAEIPYDSAKIIPSINEGTPVLLSDPHGNFSRAIKTIAQLLQKEELYSIGDEMRRERQEFKAQQKSEKEMPVSSETSADREEKIIKFKQKIHKRLIEELDLKSFDFRMDPKKQEELRQMTREKIENIMAEEGGEIYSRQERTQLVYELLDDVLGLGPLEPFLRDETVSEIMVNGPKQIYVERAGKLYLTDAHFDNNTQVMTVIDRILAPIGRRVDESSPLVDARLADGSRVNVIIPPLSLVGPAITIRKFVTNRLQMADLIKIGSLTPEMAEFLKICVRMRKNIIVSGGTGSGKTTLLNMLSSFIPDDERIITIEDSAELRLNQPHVVTLESRPPSIEGTGEITIRRLVINALRMRPDRIVVGECRGGEALDMLQAMNTGHDGSLTTLHANSPQDTINRLITLVIMAGTELPERAIRDQIAGAVDLIVQTARLSDGSRKVTEITELTTDHEGQIVLRQLFVFRQTGLKDGKVIGEFKPTGNLPTFFDEIATRGLKLDKRIFEA